MYSTLKQSIKLAPEWILMITAVIIEHHNSLTYNTHVLHENIALIFKIHKTVRHCFYVCMRSLTLKYSASLGITSSRIILEQGALASPSLFKPKKGLWGHFLVGKMCEIQSWPATLFDIALFIVVNQWIQRFFVFVFSSV